MLILLLDPDPFDAARLYTEASSLFPDETITTFSSARQLLSFAQALHDQGRQPDYLLMEAQLEGDNGLQTASALKGIFPAVKLIFCTASAEYALQAWSLHAHGYLMKPVAAESLRQTLDAMDSAWRTRLAGAVPRVRMQTFGQFEAFINDKPIHFERSRAKELLAYLVDRRGGAVTNADIAAALWEDAEFDAQQKEYVRKLISSLRKTLREVGAEDIIIRERNQIRIDPGKISCDLYSFLQGDAGAVSAYLGEYMTSYSWAESTNGALQMRD